MYSLKDILITDLNVQVLCEDKENNTQWGISFIASTDNSEYLSMVADFCTDEELEEITNQVNEITIEEV